MLKMDEILVNEKNNRWPQYLATATATLLSVSAGLHFGWPSSAIPRLRKGELQFSVSKPQIAYLIMMSPVAYIIGCSLTGVMLDRFGRKIAMLLLAVPQILAWLLIAQATGIYTLYVARFSAMISEGGVFSSVPVYICEISESKIRGSLGMTFSLAFIFGTFLINCLGSFTPLRNAAYISLIVPFLFVFTFIWMPQSPYYCIMKGDIEKARFTLRKLRRKENVEEELTKLISDIHRQTSEPSTMRDVFIIKSNLRALLILIGLRTIQQFSGGASLQFFIQLIFKEANDDSSYVTYSIMFSASLVIVTYFSSIFVDYAGRKPLLIISLTGSAICLFTEGVYFALQYNKYDVSSISLLPLTAMILYTVVRGIGLLAIPSLLTGELFSASIKAKAVGIVNFHFALCLSVSVKMFQWLSDRFGMHIPFFLFSFCCCIGIVFVYFCVPETKGKTLEEIQQLLKGNINES